MNARGTTSIIRLGHIGYIARTSISPTSHARLPQFLRSYATQRDRPHSSALLSHSLDQQRTGTRQRDSVGPFQLGLIPPTPRDAGNTKKWSELSTGGKVVRTTARMSNLVVILFGAGFSAMLVYALTSELFSKNSATVLYGQACELIKSSPKVTQYFRGTLAFHNNPPSAIRPRHRNDRVASQTGRDSSGRETLLLTFFLEAKGKASNRKEDQSFWESASEWTSQSVAAVSEMSVDETWQYTKELASEKWESARRLFRFLSGDPLPSNRPSPAIATPEVQETKQEGGWKSSFLGLFSGLRGASRETGDSYADADAGEWYSEGEVHALLVMNDNHQFEFRYLRIDVPDSQSPTRRIYVIPPNGPSDRRWL